MHSGQGQPYRGVSEAGCFSLWASTVLAGLSPHSSGEGSNSRPKANCLSEDHRAGQKCQPYLSFPTGNEHLASSSPSPPPHSCQEQEGWDSASFCKGAWEGMLDFPPSVMGGRGETGSG